MPEVAALSVKIGVDDHELTSGLARANQSVNSFDSTVQSAMTGVLVGATVAAGAGFVAAGKAAIDFEKQISNIVAVSGESAESIGRIRDEALRLGKDTSFSASEAAAGMEEMIKAGLTVEQVIGGAAQATLDLAAASGTAVAESATIMSNALNTFKADNMAAADAASILAGAANASATSVHELGYGLSSVGNVAATVGMTFEDTASLLALFAQNGLKGSDAGTSLKTMLLNLQPTTKAQIAEFERLGIATVKDGEAFATLKAALISTAEGQKAYDKLTKEGVLTTENMWKAAEKLGLAAVKGSTSFERWLSTSGNLKNAFFDQNGVVKNAAELSGILNTALAGLTKQEQLASLEIMFGTDAIRAAAIMMSGGTEAVTDMTEAMRKQGDIQRLAAERLNNVAGSWEKFTGSVETGAIVLGSLFLPALKRTIDGMTEFANQAVEALEQIPDAIETIRQVIASEWAPDSSIRPFTLAVGEAAVMVRDTFGPAITAAAGILQQLSEWVTANIAPIAAFVAGFTGAIATAGLFAAAITAVATVLGFLLSPLGLVAVAVGLLAAAWTTNFMGIQEATAAAWAAIQPVLMELVAWLGEKIPPVLEWISNTGWPAMVTAGQAVAEFITGTLIPGITELIDWLGPKLQPVVEWISGTGWPALVTAGEAVGTMVGTVIQFFKDLYVELEKRGVFTDLQTIWGQVVTVGDKVWAVIQKISELWRPFAEMTQAFNVGAGATLITTFGGIAEKAELGIKPIEAIGTGIKAIMTIISTQLAMLEKFVGLIGSLKDIRLPSLPGMGGAQQMSFGGGGGSNEEKIARAAAARGYDPATLLALVKHETGNMSSQLAKDANNLFSIKGQGSAGSITLPAWEVVNGQNVTSNETFRRYNSVDESINDFFDLIENSSRYAAAVASKGDPEKFMRGLQSGGYATDPSWATNVLRGRTSVQVPNIGDMGDIKVSQAQWGASVGMTPQEAAAACGPYAAYLFAQATGRTPNPAEAEQLARAAGWTEAGMGGTGNFMNLLGRMGVNAVRTGTIGMSSADITAMAAQSGSMTGFSTPGHYFASTGFDPASGKFNVGATGTFAGGETWMTVQQMSALMGPVQDIITLGGQMGAAFGAAGRQVTDGIGIIPPAMTSTSAAATELGTSFTTTAQTAQEAGLQLMGSQTDALGNVMSVYATAAGDIVRTTTDQNGQVLSQYATLASGATLEMGNLAAGVTTSQTQLGANLLTTVTDTAGTYVTTITDMSGQIVSQFAGTAAGVIASTAAQNTGVLQSYNLMGTGAVAQVTDMGGQIVTKLTETSGLSTTTVTAMGGAILSQMTTLKDGTVVQMDDMNVKTTTAFDVMSQTTTTTVTTMSGEVIKTVTDMNGQVVAQTIDTRTKVSQEWTATSADVVKLAADMGLQVIGSSRKMGEDLVTATKSSTGEMVTLVTDATGKVIGQFKELADGGKIVAQGMDVAKKGLDGAIKAMREAEKQAEKTADAMSKFGGSKSSPGKKMIGFASGGAVSGFEPIIVGERGPEVFVPGANGYIVPNHALRGGGGGGGTQTIRLQVEIGGRVAEEIYVTGQRLAVERGRA